MKNTLLKILMKLTGASRQLIELIWPIFRDNAAKLLSDLAPIAMEVVLSHWDNPHSGAQKREAALREIQARAVQSGIRASTSAVNLAIELAVQNLKTQPLVK